MNRTSTLALRACVAMLLTTLAWPANAQVNKTYTLDADFDEGSKINLNSDHPNFDQLQLNTETTPLPYIWIALSARGTIARVDVVTGEILGEYFSAPQGRGRNVSRTTVDLFGNVWAGNRGEGTNTPDGTRGSAVKAGVVVGGTRIGADKVTPDPNGPYLQPPFQYSTCQDRDGDGLIRTSRGANDLLPWSNTGGADSLGGVTTATDECVLLYVRAGGPVTRHVSIDANNDVWVSGYGGSPTHFFQKVDGDTGAILSTFQATSCGGYGGFVDGNGILWSGSLANRLLRYDPSTGTHACVTTPFSYAYGLGIDPAGHPWVSNFGSLVSRIDPATGAVLGSFNTGGGNTRGVAVSSDGSVWVANSGSASVARLTAAGALTAVIAVGSGPTGVAVDGNGKIWVTNVGSHNAMRIDPAINAVDLTVNLQPNGGALSGPYNYSDMTGTIAVGSTSPQGTWSVTQDSGNLGNQWNRIFWNTEPEGSEPAGTSITVQARAADNVVGLASASFVPVSSNVALGGVSGRFIEVRATLRPNADGDSPVLSDITVEGNQAPVAVAQDLVLEAGPGGVANGSVDNGSFDPDGDPITLTQTPAGPYAIGVHVVTLTVTDDKGLSDSATATITVVDTTAPTITSVTPSTGMLWPPNHRMVDVSLTVVAGDIADPNVSCSITGVTSSQPDNAQGDGNTTGDWNITGPLTVQLRAERQGGNRSGRTYTIDVTCTDASGNSSTGTTTVLAPHNRGR